jgi:integrase
LELSIHRPANRGQEKTTHTNPNQVLFVLLTGTGMRIGEALGLRVQDISDDYSTIQIHQSVWRGKPQSPKTANAEREIDLHSDWSAMLKTFIAGRVEGYVFQSKSHKPLTQRNVLRNGFGTIRRDMELTQARLGFHAFRRFTFPKAKQQKAMNQKAA